MATLNYLTSDWLKCGLLCFCVIPDPKCSIGVCYGEKSLSQSFQGADQGEMPTIYKKKKRGKLHVRSPFSTWNGVQKTHKMSIWMYVRTQQGNFPWDASDKRQKSWVCCSSSVCSVLFISGGSLSSWHLARVSRTQKLTARWQLESRLRGRGAADCRVIRATALFHRFSADTCDGECKINYILEQKLFIHKFPSVMSQFLFFILELPFAWVSRWPFVSTSAVADSSPFGFADLLTFLKSAVLVMHLIHQSIKFCCCCPSLAVSLFHPFFVLFLDNHFWSFISSLIFFLCSCLLTSSIALLCTWVNTNILFW